MPVRHVPFPKIERWIRKKKFGFLGSITKEGRAHVTGVMYAPAPPGGPFSLFILTGTRVHKTRNVRANPNVSFGIPFAHHLARPAPDFCVQFQGTAEVLRFNHPAAQEALRRRRMMRRTLKKTPLDTRERVVVRVVPDARVHGFGLGMNLVKLLRNIESGRFVGEIPPERRAALFHGA